MTEKYPNTAPARQAFTITPSDTVPVSPTPKAFRANTSGTIALRAIDSAQDVTLTVTAGELVLIRPRFIRATGTTATGLLGLA